MATTNADNPPGSPSPAEDSERSPQSTRVQIVFDESAMKTLDDVKKAYGTRPATTAMVIRDALGFFSWAQKEISSGNRIGIVGSDGKVREVILPFQMM